MICDLYASDLITSCTVWIYLQKKLNKDFIFINSFTDKFRLDWYAIFLRELAKSIKLDKTIKKKKLSVSIVWYLFDRREWDCLGNIEEIKRILWLLWVEVNSFWLDWWNYKDLSKIEDSELIISFPYWKYASKVLSKRLWIDFIELDVPFWIKDTVNFVKEVWEKLWISGEFVSGVISKELSFVKQKVDLLDEKVFLNKNYVYAWDPFLESWIVDIWNFLGMNNIRFYSYTWVNNPIEGDLWGEKLDFIIWNSEFNMDFFEWPKLEFGFPSFDTHFLLNRPYMWFRGLLFFVERLYGELLERGRFY